MSFDGEVENYENMKNVRLVSKIFPEEQWSKAFPHAHELYDYTGFLKAVARFPAFCNETQLKEDSAGTGDALEQSCRIELATIFAHWGQETGKRSHSEGEFWTQGLYYTEEIVKNDYKSWNWSNDAWPNQAGVQYYGRGPMQLSWNYNYGQFSNVATVSRYDSKMDLLMNPQMVSQSGDMAMSAGLWFYMTP